jgi:hypothetical protein
LSFYSIQSTIPEACKAYLNVLLNAIDLFIHLSELEIALVEALKESPETQAWGERTPLVRRARIDRLKPKLQATCNSNFSAVFRMRAFIFTDRERRLLESWLEDGEETGRTRKLFTQIRRSTPQFLSNL